jgi:hypothetical protein
MRLARFCRSSFFVAAAVAASALSLGVGCASESSSGNAASGDEQDQTSDAATLKLTSDFQTKVIGQAAAGQGLRIEYALERLPQCRGNVGGGGPGWNISGFYSENGGVAKSFEVTALTPDGKDRVAKPAHIVPSAGGDIAIWFEVTSAFGCHEFDSQFGQNFHLAVKGPSPVAGASIAFAKDGTPTVDGELKAGGKVKITYDQDRLPQCRRVEQGNPVWTITGFAQVDRESVHMFDTARPENGDRKEIEALVDLPHSGELSLWFQVTSLGGCMQYDSKSGANYRFPIAD